jgi:hypothetical protein
MLRFASFVLIAGLSAALPVRGQHQNKQETKDDQNKKKAEPAKQAPKDDSPKDGDERIDRRNSRMKERAREIDRMLNDKQNK